MNRFGGNTSCVVVQREGESPIVLDAGTGLRFFGLDAGIDDFDGIILISHLHWDHVQGLPFFPQLLHPNTKTTIYGPPEDDASFSDTLGAFVRPPYFPVSFAMLSGSIELVDLWDSSFTVGSATVTARSVPHQGKTNGFRIEWPDFSLAYIPDHQQPHDDTSIAPGVLELADGVDLLIHDSQFTNELLEKRPNWGHCTPQYALHVAETAGASALSLFHHDPLHNDEDLDALFADLLSADTSCEIVPAAEGLKLSF